MTYDSWADCRYVVGKDARFGPAKPRNVNYIPKVPVIGFLGFHEDYNQYCAGFFGDFGYWSPDRSVRNDTCLKTRKAGKCPRGFGIKVPNKYVPEYVIYGRYNLEKSDEIRELIQLIFATTVRDLSEINDEIPREILMTRRCKLNIDLDEVITVNSLYPLEGSVTYQPVRRSKKFRGHTFQLGIDVGNSPGETVLTSGRSDMSYSMSLHRDGKCIWYFVSYYQHPHRTSIIKIMNPSINFSDPRYIRRKIAEKEELNGLKNFLKFMENTICQ
ncbi:MAG: hypothetical protein J4428_05000 [Candidatus Aenigmarchaeota archaeon]|nr:hypothetical protein [Candidatus Aenigmarchaeota archaeon]